MICWECRAQRHETCLYPENCPCHHLPELPWSALYTVPPPEDASKDQDD